MLGMPNYPQEYIDACRSKVDSDVAAYSNFVSAAGGPAAEAGSFETAYFTNLVLLLDYLFVHRLAGPEGKDGNPLNEVRMLCNSILNSRPAVQQYGGKSAGVMVPEKTIKYSDEKSVLGYQIGDEIQINKEQFERIPKAFFDELQRKFAKQEAAGAKV
jgi:hypothetical protein